MAWEAENLAYRICAEVVDARDLWTASLYSIQGPSPKLSGSEMFCTLCEGIFTDCHSQIRAKSLSARIGEFDCHGPVCEVWMTSPEATRNYIFYSASMAGKSQVTLLTSMPAQGWATLPRLGFGANASAQGSFRRSRPLPQLTNNSV